MSKMGKIKHICLYEPDDIEDKSKKVINKRRKVFWLDIIVAIAETLIALIVFDKVATDFLNEVEYSIEGIIDVIIILFFSTYSSVRLLMLNDKK